MGRSYFHLAGGGGKPGSPPNGVSEQEQTNVQTHKEVRR